MDRLQALEALDKLNSELDELVASKKISPREELQFKVIYEQKKLFMTLLSSFHSFKALDKKFEDINLGNINDEKNKHLAYGMFINYTNTISFVIIYKALCDYIHEVNFRYKPMKDTVKDFFDYVLYDKKLLGMVKKLI